MTVGRLLQEATSMELTQWQLFLKADQAYQKDQMRRAREDREILGDESL